MSGRPGITASAGYQSASQLALAGGREWLLTLGPEEKELAQNVGPGVFQVFTADGTKEIAADHFVLLAGGALVLRGPATNELAVFAPGCWQGIEVS